MFEHILVPIDLAEKERWARAVDVAGDLAQRYGAWMTLVSVAGGLQGKVSHSDETYARLLDIFADELGARFGVRVGAKVYSVPDPSVEVDGKLLEAVEALGVDLVVTASHQPVWSDRLINSHSGRLARAAPVSVFVVRDARN